MLTHSDLQLNHDGILFYIGRHMCARDQFGRFVGQLFSDDEIGPLAEEKLSAEDSIFAQFVAADITPTDIEDDTGDDIDVFAINFADVEEHLGIAHFAEDRYRADYPELWIDESDVEIEEVSSSTVQSSIQLDDRLKKLRYWSRKTDIIRSDNHGYRGRSKYLWDQKGRKSRSDCKRSWRKISHTYNQIGTPEEVLETFITFDHSDEQALFKPAAAPKIPKQEILEAA